MSAMVTIYDAVDLGALPPEAATGYMLGYVDGRATAGHYAACRARFPRARVIPVTTTGIPGVPVVDVERFDCTPEMGAGLANWSCARGRGPTTLYFGEASRRAVLLALSAFHRGLGHGGNIYAFVANYDGRAVLDNPTDVAHQYASTSYDVSIALASWADSVAVA